MDFELAPASFPGPLGWRVSWVNLPIPPAHRYVFEFSATAAHLAASRIASRLIAKLRLCFCEPARRHALFTIFEARTITSKVRLKNRLHSP